MSHTDMTTIAEPVARALSGNPRAVAQETTTLRGRYDTVGFTRQ
jgi:hypothetical protein